MAEYLQLNTLILIHWPETLMNQPFIITYNVFLKTSLKWMPPPLHLSIYLTKSMFIHLPSPISTHQAMYAGQAACAMNVFMQSPPGGMTDPDTTVFWSTPMNFSKVCME